MARRSTKSSVSSKIVRKPATAASRRKRMVGTKKVARKRASA